MAIRVLIADAQPLFSEVLAITLDRQDGLEVLDWRPSSGLEAAEAVISHLPDVALIDYWMADMQAPRALETIANWTPEPKVIVTSWLHGAPHIQAALDAGAVGFLTKSVTAVRVAEAIRRAHAGESPVFAEQLRELVQELRRSQSSVDDAWAKIPPLSRRDLQVLGLLSLGLSPVDVSKRLWIAPGTVNDHIHHILSKFGVKSSAQAVALAMRSGLIKSSPTTKIN